MVDEEYKPVRASKPMAPPGGGGCAPPGEGYKGCPYPGAPGGAVAPCGGPAGIGGADAELAFLATMGGSWTRPWSGGGPGGGGSYRNR